MPTAESVKEKLQGLIDSANATTGEVDTTLTDAIERLIAGFGGGSGVKAATGEFTTGSSATAITAIRLACDFVPTALAIVPFVTSDKVMSNGYPIGGFVFYGGRGCWAAINNNSKIEVFTKTCTLSLSSGSLRITGPSSDLSAKFYASTKHRWVAME